MFTWTVWVETSTRSRRGIESITIGFIDGREGESSSFSGISWPISIGFDVDVDDGGGNVTGEGR